jgi:hypothetical protein
MQYITGTAAAYSSVNTANCCIVAVAVVTGKHDQQRREMAARYLLRLFRVGKLGRVTLDAIDQPYPHKVLISHNINFF